MAHAYTPAIARRLTATLFATQSLASAGLIATFTVNPIVGARLSGNDALAGVPGTLLLIGAATAAYPFGRLMQRFGRRPGLTLGFFTGMIGMLTSGVAVIAASFPLYLLGLALIGASRGAIDQSRYAAADAQPPAQRARAISTVVFAGTIGAVGGPLLVDPLGKLTERLGYDPLAGPMFGGSLLLGVAGLVMFAFLRPDPRDIAGLLAGQQAEAAPVAGEARPIGALLRRPAVQLALAGMIFGQIVMVLVMTVTSLHMHHGGHGLGDVSIVIGSHTLGMFGLSVLTGLVADRFGRPATLGLGALLLIAGSLLAPVSLHTPLLALALFLVGLGWNMCTIGGSSLLADSLAPSERGAMQGAGDLAVNLSAACSSLSSGFIMAALGFGFLCVLGAGLALVPLALAGWFSLRRAALAPRGA